MRADCRPLEEHCGTHPVPVNLALEIHLVGPAMTLSVDPVALRHDNKLVLCRANVVLDTSYKRCGATIWSSALRSDSRVAFEQRVPDLARRHADLLGIPRVGNGPPRIGPCTLAFTPDSAEKSRSVRQTSTARSMPMISALLTLAGRPTAGCVALLAQAARTK